MPQIRDRKRWLCSASQVNRHRAGVVVPSMFPSGNGWDSSDVPAEESVAPTGKLYFLQCVIFLAAEIP